MNKKKKSALMIMLSLMLASSGCSRTTTNNEFRENAYERIEELIDDRDFYQETHAGDTNEEFYAPFYKKYLDNFIKYMNEDQYDNFYYMVYLVDEDERYDFPKIYDFLNGILYGDQEYGHGFYYAFNTRIIFESLFSAYDLRDDTFTHVNTLRDIVNNDEEFFQSIFSQDRDALIDCIVKNTNFSDRSLVEEMLLKFDIYVDNLESSDYLSEQLKNDASERIQEIMNELVASKCKDPEFADTFYGRMLKQSRYYGSDEIELTRYLIEDTFELVEKNNKGSLSLTLPNNCYYSNHTLNSIKYEKIISNISEEIEESKSDTLTLFSFLVNEDVIEKLNSTNAESIRATIYEDLSNYFDDELDFNDFYLRLDNRTQSSLERYFKIFESRIKEDGITLLDYARYYSLVELNKRHTYNHYEFYDRDDYITYDELRKLKPEEYEGIVDNYYPENYFLYNFNYQNEFDKIQYLLSNNDLGFNVLYSSPNEITWPSTGFNLDSFNDSQVLSKEIQPTETEIDGNKLIYYECPEGYENAEAVEVFLNIDNELTTREVKGFITEIVDPESSSTKSVYLVGINNNIDEFPSVCFLSNYGEIKGLDNTQKKLTYEVTYE